MIDGVYEPLALYRDQFKAKHAEITAAFFEGLTKCSGVDENANAATVAAIRAIEAQIAAADSSRSNWRIIRILAVILVVTAVIGLVLFIVPVLSPDTEIPLRADLSVGYGLRRFSGGRNHGHCRQVESNHPSTLRQPPVTPATP